MLIIAHSFKKIISSPLKIHAPPPNYKFSYKTTVNNTTIMTDKSLKSLVSLKLLNTHRKFALFIYLCDENSLKLLDTTLQLQQQTIR